MEQPAPRRPYLIRSLILLALPAALALAVVALFRARPSEPTATTAAAGSNDEVAQLRGELQALRRQLHVVSQQQAPASNLTPTTDNASATPTPPPLTEEEAAARDRRRFEGLARKLAAEPVDRQWGPATERVIADALSKPLFKGTKLLGASCHSTLCRFEVLHDTEADRRKFSSSLPSRLPSLPSGSMRNAEGSDRKTIVYVAREGHQVPRDDPQ
jgi:hypothetical protein